jgi:hypothetical protein
MRIGEFESVCGQDRRNLSYSPGVSVLGKAEHRQGVLNALFDFQKAVKTLSHRNRKQARLAKGLAKVKNGLL